MRSEAEVQTEVNNITKDLANLTDDPQAQEHLSAMLYALLWVLEVINFDE